MTKIVRPNGQSTNPTPSEENTALIPFGNVDGSWMPGIEIIWKVFDNLKQALANPNNGAQASSVPMMSPVNESVLLFFIEKN